MVGLATAEGEEPTGAIWMGVEPWDPVFRLLCGPVGCEYCRTVLEEMANDPEARRSL